MGIDTENLDILHRVLIEKRNGGISHRVINYDNSLFWHVVPDTEINSALLIESERISSLKLENRYINMQKSTVYARHKRLMDNNIHFRATRFLKAEIFKGTDYSIPIYGNLEQIRTFDANSVKRIYNTYRDLSGIIVVICGKFDITQIKREINRRFAGITPLRPPPKKPKTKIITPSPFVPRKAPYHENWLVDNLNESFSMIAVRAPSKFNVDHLYFDFIRYYLLDERISKLDEVFNKINKLNIHISYEFTNHHDANVLIIKLSCKSRSNLEKAKYYLNKKLNALKKGKGAVSGGDLKMVKTLMELDFLKQMTVLEKRSLFLAEQYYVFGDLEGEDKYLSRIRKILGLDIFRISRKYLQKSNRVRVNVYPKKNK